MSSSPAGAVIPVQEGRGLDLGDTRQQDHIHLCVRHPDESAGNAWQGIAIPLSHFRNDGIKETAGCPAVKQKMNWRRIDKLLINANLKPMRLDIAAVEVIY